MSRPALHPLPMLPLHLSLAMTEWLSLTTACACASSASPHLKRMSALPPSPEGLSPELQSAVRREAKNRLLALLSGIKRYQSTPYSRELKEPPAIWRCGNARLLDYTTTSKNIDPLLPALLLIPSLVNRHYILDLRPGRSFARYLSAQGIPCLLLDWGEPGSVESAFACAEYVTRILAPAAEFLHRAGGRKIIAGGYCMGGVFALALAQLYPQHVEALALLATPWDFSAGDIIPPRLNAAMAKQLEDALLAEKTIAPDVIQAMFYLQNPWAFQQKFQHFAEMDESTQAFRDFLALEGWVNDGVPMAPRVAHECLIGWGQQNTLCKGNWKVNGVKITPSRITQSAFFAIPQADRIVPKASALALADAMPEKTIISPSSGHVGMIVGSRARKELWEPFAAWVRCIK